MGEYQCKEECLDTNLSCAKKTCKHWINFDQDLNCSLISIDAHGAMTLDQISKRLGLSIVRIKQIEESALTKIKKKNNNIIKDLLHE